MAASSRALAAIALIAMSLVGCAAEQFWVRRPRSKLAYLVDDSTLGDLCDREGLDVDAMRLVAKGKRRHFKGWSCGPIEFVGKQGDEDDGLARDMLESIAATVIDADSITADISSRRGAGAVCGPGARVRDAHQPRRFVIS